MPTVNDIETQNQAATQPSSSPEKRQSANDHDELKRMFEELKMKWKDDTLFVSSTTEIVHNANYQSIIGLGPEVIPLLLQDLSESRNYWFPALKVISRENPVDKADAGNIKKMTEAWLDWGRREGHI